MRMIRCVKNWRSRLMGGLSCAGHHGSCSMRKSKNLVEAGRTWRGLPPPLFFQKFIKHGFCTTGSSPFAQNMLVSDKQMHRSAKEVGFLLAHLTDSITTFITSLYVTAGLAGIVLAMAIESCCIPLPSEIVMPLAGVMIVTGKLLAGVNFGLSLILVALAGSIGCLIGSVAAYGIGYAGGRPLMLKYGRYVLISQHDADRADHFFQKWGSATVFFARLLPVVRTYISLPAGIAKMPFAKFCLYTF